MTRTSGADRLSARLQAVAIALACAGVPRMGLAAGVTRDVQSIGLAPLYELLFAVANCPNVALDEPAFRRAARLYRLTPRDLTGTGDFAAEVAGLAAAYRVRLEDDRVAFCDARRLRFAVPHGVLVDRGPEVPRPFLGLGPDPK